MPKLLAVLSGLLFALVVLAGCTRPAPSDYVQVPTATGPSSVVWRDEGTKVDGTTIRLGFRVSEPRDASCLEPVVSITHEGQPAPDAMVFCRLVSADGAAELGDEVPTIYEAPAAGQPACYAPGKLPLPASGQAAAVRFRVVLAGSDQDWTQDAGP